jgi:Transposase, Mutator family
VSVEISRGIAPEDWPPPARTPIIYLDAVVVKLCDGAHVRNQHAHIAVAVDMDGIKHVLGVWVQASEGAKFWAGVCAELANRGVADVLIACCDGLTGFPEPIKAGLDPVGAGLGNTLLQPQPPRERIRAMVTTRVEAAHYLKDAGGLKLVVFGADGHEVAAMFVRGSVTYDEEEATFIAVAEDGHTVGELFVDETVGYDENTDAFVIRTAQ